MHKGLVKAGAIFAAIAVVLGAFGAHALKQVAPDQAVNVFETAVRYQFYHVFAIFVTGILYKDFPLKLIVLAGKFFMAGIVFFSGSLYLLTYLAVAGVQGYSWVGAITPVGGLLFIVGWLLLLFAIIRQP